MSALNDRLSSSLRSRSSRSILRQLTPSNSSSAKPLVDFSSNDYLSLSKSDKLHANFLSSFSPEGFSPYGPPSSRLLDGNSPHHIACEDQLGAFLGGPSALLFNSGFDANVALWTVLPAPDDFVLYDELIHASTHDGMRASRVPKERRIAFKHNNLADLERRIQELAKDVDVREGRKNVWVGVETLYSMDGDLAPLAEMVNLVERILPARNGHFVVDEAHSTGIYGRQGRGIVSLLGLEERVTIRVHTFGKAMACSGAVVLATPLIRSYLINYARPLIYSTVMPRMNVVAISHAFSLLARGEADQAAQHLHSLSQLLTARLANFLSPTTPNLSLFPSTPPRSLPPTSPIVPLLTPAPRALASFLQARGFLVRPITYPTVPKGQERVRVCLHAGNTREQVESLLVLIKEWADARRREARL